MVVIIENHQPFLFPPCFFSTVADYVSKALVATCIIFGVSTNSELSNKNGLNEFLSALTAIYALSPVVQSLGVLVEIALIIEATIPFRSKDRETGLTVGETLRKRLNKVSVNITSFLKYKRPIYWAISEYSHGWMA